MSEAPERIWAWTWYNRTYAGKWHVDAQDEATEYVRKDLFDAVKAERAALEARVKALTAALQWCSGSPDFNEGGQARVGWLKLCAPLIESE